MNSASLARSQRIHELLSLSLEISKSGAEGAGRGLGRALCPSPVSASPIRNSASQRALRYRAEIEVAVRAAGIKFRDNDQEASVVRAFRMWWSSGMRGQRFAHLIRGATEITQARISLGSVERGCAGRREAMPYFFEVLHELTQEDRPERRGARAR